MRGGVTQIGFKKSKPIPVLPPLQGGENPHGVGQAGWGKIAICRCDVSLI